MYYHIYSITNQSPVDQDNTVELNQHIPKFIYSKNIFDREIRASSMGLSSPKLSKILF